jgi:hypothetical protein
MGDPSTLRGLLERVKSATGADLELDALLVCALRLPITEHDYANNWEGAWKSARTPNGNLRIEWWSDLDDGDGPAFWTASVPAYTASLDAALALVERACSGWRAQFWQQRTGRWHCRLIRDAGYRLVTTEDEDRTRDGDNEIAGARPTPALALLAAMLEAQLQEGENA